MYQPLITIIIPVYNVDAYLSSCMDSVLAQTHTNLQILLIDDGSTDASGRICDHYQSRDARITVIHQENRGVSAARNVGLRHAKGAYIGFMDGDDWAEPDLYRVLLETLFRNQAEMAVCGHWIHHDGGWVEIRSDKTLSGMIPQQKALICLQQKHLFEGALWNKLFSRSLLIRAGEGALLLFDENLSICEDLLYVGQCMLKTSSICYAPRPLYHYRIRQGGALRTFGRARSSELCAREQLVRLLEPCGEEVSALAKRRLLGAALDQVVFAVMRKDDDEIPLLQDQVRKYGKAYHLDFLSNQWERRKLRLVLQCPVLTTRVWSALKTIVSIKIH
ncbi:glycosyltransferase, partial [Desulfosarcina sp. OttesenSCG-928-G17]|nr:glycosyltransferase [Desulfosarcina sp. OttesenSCG-928-G17]